MAQIIDNLYRNKIMGQRPDWIKTMSDEELDASIKQLEAQNGEQRKSRALGAIQDVGNIFLQKGGMQPVKRDNGDNNINDFIMKELLKQQLTPKTAQERLAEMELSTLEKDVQPAQLPAEPSEVVPTDAMPQQQPTPTSAMQNDPEPPQFVKKQKGTNKYTGKPEYEEVLNPSWKSWDERRNELAKTQQNPETISQLVNDASAVLTDITNSRLVNSANVGMMGPIKLWGTKKYTLMSQVERLRALLTLPNLKYLKGLGHMSDREFNTVSASVAALNYNMPPSDFNKELQRINEALQNTKARMGGTQTQPSQPTTQPQGQPQQVSPDLITDENINATAQKYGITPEEVKKKLGVQ